MNTFVETRQSPSNNPHLKAVYQKLPDFQQGWGKNFKEFSPSIKSQLKDDKEKLQLTEDSWDLFVSGFEMGTCQSPDGLRMYSKSTGKNKELSYISLAMKGLQVYGTIVYQYFLRSYGLLRYNKALMSYVMDGRNAMIVKKNSNEHITARAVVKIVFDSTNTSVLLIENIHVRKPSDRSLIMSAAREIAAEMKLSLYKVEADLENEQEKPLKVLEGRAPFDYIQDDSLKRCSEFFIKKAVKVEAKTGEQVVIATGQEA